VALDASGEWHPSKQIMTAGAYANSKVLVLCLETKGELNNETCISAPEECWDLGFGTGKFVHTSRLAPDAASNTRGELRTTDLVEISSYPFRLQASSRAAWREGYTSTVTCNGCPRPCSCIKIASYRDTKYMAFCLVCYLVCKSRP
jgi:hypothetical protein